MKIHDIKITSGVPENRQESSNSLFTEDEIPKRLRKADNTSAENDGVA